MNAKPNYDPESADGLNEYFSDWLYSTSGIELDFKLSGWTFELEPNTGAFGFSRPHGRPDDLVVLRATPWLGGDGVQVSLLRQYFGSNQFDGKSLWTQTYPLPKTGDFRQDWKNYLALMARVLPQASRAFDELKDQPMLETPEEQVQAWNAFVGQLKPGDRVKFDHTRAADRAATTSLDLGKELTADQVLDLYQQAKQEADPAKREQLMRQVRAASAALESRVGLLVNTLLS